ncbi:hypothetical protein [uncultured Sneathia sp.]|uniref:hypothetical protein n=1 Tax=uncultured Sneathia sp. TaxID=278067 RepID=UPI002585C1A5|nr:hypothetical protein [uncultured Sneathia sp.]
MKYKDKNYDYYVGDNTELIANLANKLMIEQDNLNLFIYERYGRNFNQDQMNIIRHGLNTRLDVSIYANEKYS